MTTFTDDWDATFEGKPTDDNYGYEIDNYIRRTMLAVRERMVVDHEWKNGALDGKPKRYRMIDSTVADQGAVSADGNNASVVDFKNTAGTTWNTTFVFSHDGQSANTTYTFLTDISLPSNINIIVENGAILSDGAGSANLTINGPFEAPLKQVFSWTGSGAVTFGDAAIEEACSVWWGALPTATSAINAAAIQAACDAYDHVYISKGTFTVNVAIDPGDNKHVRGEGAEKTIIKNDGIGGVVFYAPGQKGSMDKISIDGNDVAGSIGIQADATHKPYSASWGRVYVKNCASIGVNFTYTGASGIFYNSFKQFNISECVVGMKLTTSSGAAAVNANNFGVVNIANGGGDMTYGLHIDTASGNKFDYLSVEGNSASEVGIYMENGHSNIIAGGWLEALNVNIDIGDNPDVTGFTYLGNTDDTFANCTYTYSANRSILTDDSSGGQYRIMAGRWFFENLEAYTAQGGTSLIRYPELAGYGLEHANFTTGATISVKGINAVFLNYGAGEAITDFTNQKDYQVIHIETNNGNATIANSGNFKLSAAWNPGQYDTLTLMYSTNFAVWIELARSTN